MTYQVVVRNRAQVEIAEIMQRYPSPFEPSVLFVVNPFPSPQS